MAHGLAEASASDQECARVLHECLGNTTQQVLRMINGKNASGNENDEKSSHSISKMTMSPNALSGSYLTLTIPFLGRVLRSHCPLSDFSHSAHQNPSAKSSMVPQRVSEHPQEQVPELRPWAGDTLALSAPRRLLYTPYSHSHPGCLSTYK